MKRKTSRKRKITKRKKTSFAKALYIQQVGPQGSVVYKKKRYYKVGGGYFTGDQLVKARKNFGRIKLGKKF